MLRLAVARVRLEHESEVVRKKNRRREGLAANNMGLHGSERKRWLSREGKEENERAGPREKKEKRKERKKTG